MRMPSPRHIALALLLIGSVVFLLISIRGGGSGPAVQGDRPKTTAADVAPAQEEPALVSAVPDDVDYGRYAKLAQTNIFSERRAAPPPPPKVRKLDPIPPLPGSEPDRPITPKVDFSGWSYMGYVELDGRKLGLLQNDTTHSCEYLALGDSFMGAKVDRLDREDIRLSVGGSRTTLSRPRDFSVSPLDKQAGSTPAPRQQR